MEHPFIAAEAIERARLTTWSTAMELHHDPPRRYVPNGAERTQGANAAAAWLWTSRQAIMALMDGGAQSPRETRLRPMLIDEACRHHEPRCG